MKTDFNKYPNWGMMPLTLGLKHFEDVYKWTSAILDAINRCKLDEQYWITTKGGGMIIIIHCEDHYYEGNCRTFSLAVAKIETAEDFIRLIEISGILERGEYPWINFKKGDDDGQVQGK